MTVDSRWIKTKSDEQAVRDGCTFDIRRSERVRTFLKTFCCHSIGKWCGKPFDLLPFQWEEIVCPLYSWIAPDGITRRFKVCSVWIPRNAGKTSLGAALNLYHLIGEDERAAYCINIATSIEQADIAFKSTMSMIEQSPDLQDLVESEILWPRSNIRQIEYKPIKNKPTSILKVMAGERSGSKHGHPISFCCMDEIAQFTDRTLYETIRNNIQKRDGALMFTISTAGYRSESIGYENFHYCKDILSGEKIDTHTLPVVYAADPKADWKSLDTYKACNPGYGVTVNETTWKPLVTEAINEPRKAYSFKTEFLNLWQGSQACWIPPDKWRACGIALSEEDLWGCKAWAGTDCAFKADLWGYTLVVEKDDIVYLLPRAFSPRILAERKSKIDHVPYPLWAEQGHITLTDGNVADPAAVRAKMVEDAQHFKIQELGFDPNKGFEESRQILERDHNFITVEVPQAGQFLGPAALWLERAVLEGTKVRHPQSPIFNWCLDNCTSKEKPSGVMVYKANEYNRIDIVIAALIGISRYIARDQNDTPQFWTF